MAIMQEAIEQIKKPNEDWIHNTGITLPIGLIIAMFFMAITTVAMQ